MEPRSMELQLELEDLLGTENVYFQPGSSVRMKYPCFVFNRTTAFQPKADDKTYLFRPGYEVTYINRDEPDPEILERVSRRFYNCRYNRHYIADNLHHDTFTIYY